MTARLPKIQVEEMEPGNNQSRFHYLFFFCFRFTFYFLRRTSFGPAQVFNFDYPPNFVDFCGIIRSIQPLRLIRSLFRPSLRPHRGSREMRRCT